MTTADSIVLLLINKVDTVWSEEKQEDVKLESPIVRWKQLIGNKDPDAAKTEEPLPSLKVANPDPEAEEKEIDEVQNRLRGVFGKDSIRNAFWGSDDAKAANKERDIFLLPIPEKPPAFSYIKTKVSIDNILKFMFPPNLEHSNSTGRLDLFALYGPTVLYHSVDSCFCSDCTPLAKNQLKLAIYKRQEAARKKSGLSADDPLNNSKSVSMRGTQKTVQATRKLMEAPQRLLQEEDINDIMPDLCEKC